MGWTLLAEKRPQAVSGQSPPTAEYLGHKRGLLPDPIAPQGPGMPIINAQDPGTM